jgi:AcrR family transcriptional regulator
VRAKTINKRNQFLQAGKELFFEKGYISVSVKEICDKLDTTTGSFYFMFSSKEKLLEELLIESLTHLWTTGRTKRMQSTCGKYFYLEEC